MKASSNKITIKRRKMSRDNSVSGVFAKTATTTKNLGQKLHPKNSSYELKPLKSHLSISSIKNSSQGALKPAVHKKIMNFGSNATNALINSMICPKPKKPDLPMSSQDALRVFSNDLNPYEKAEILDYSEVYFLGNKYTKMIPKIELENYGFDDTRGDLKVIKGDHIAFRYEILNLLGKGSFGQVCECYDYKRDEKVAVKIIRNKKRFHRQASIEISILEHLRENDPAGQKSVIKMKNYFLFRNHVCITFDLWFANLYEFMKVNKFQPVSLSLIKRFTLLLLKGLNYLKSLDIIHCDLKPENILLKYPNKADIVIIDFGSATFFNQKQHFYIQSRFYRAPEIILGIPYTAAIDMWSLGCILAELCMGKPLFPGESEHDQLILIMEILGNPPYDLLEQGSKKDLFFNNNILKDSTVKQIYTKPGSKQLNDVIYTNNQDFLDFLYKCLEWNPSARITPEKALRHPWISEKIIKSMSNLSYLDKNLIKNNYFF